MKTISNPPMEINNPPIPLLVQFENIPDQIKEFPHWVLWKYEFVNGRWTKVPYQINGRKASCSNNSTWSDYQSIYKTFDPIKYSGVGFVLSEQSPITGIDFDGCPENYQENQQLENILKAMDSYTERSPSGRGFRCFVLGQKTFSNCKAKVPDMGIKEIEIYDNVRFLTVTGQRVDSFSHVIEERQSALDDLCQTLWPKQPELQNHMTQHNDTSEVLIPDDELLARIATSQQREKFISLYQQGKLDAYGDDHSAADMALCNMLAFWTRGNRAQMDRLFRGSKLFREKWDERRGEHTYGDITLNKAIERTSDHYSGCINKGAGFEDRGSTSNPEEFDLSYFSLKGKSKSLEMQMLEEVYVMKPIALLGQCTAIYAPPNAGKTLLTIHLLVDGIKSGRVKGDDIYYINADDTLKGLITKLKIAEENSFEMLVPGHRGFETKMFVRYLKVMIKTESANGKIIILDTLKKFTDLMDKKMASAFMNIAREFVSKGGTIIFLCHTNKHKDSEGKGVYGGTSDIVDDADCAYVMDVKSDDKFTKHVRLRNIKSRGNVEPEIDYQYISSKESSYLDRLSSIKSLSVDEIQTVVGKAEMHEDLTENAELIDVITSALNNGYRAKTKLIQYVNFETGVNRAKILKVLNCHTGIDYCSGHRWQYSIQASNSHLYSLLDNGVPSYIKADRVAYS